uniref:Uncharacterized protein n=1 Tax=Glycine max TaxID=3847 RepID=A0A0R0GS60_SOYBN
MMRRRHKGRAIRRVIMNHQSTGRACVDLLSNKCIPSRSRGLLHVLALELLRPCDPTSYHESSKQQAEPVLTFYLINASLPEVGVVARISSRITTVIRVVDTIKQL